jgi:hypothetical protein
MLQNEIGEYELKLIRERGASGKTISGYDIAALAASKIGPRASELEPLLRQRAEELELRFGKVLISSITKLRHGAEIAAGLRPPESSGSIDGTGSLSLNTQYGAERVTSHLESR